MIKYGGYLFALFALTLSLALSTSILQILLGISNVITWIGSGGYEQLVVGVGSRTIFSSRVPEILYENIVLDDDISSVYRVVTGIIMLKGYPVVVKGFEYDDIKELYGDYVSMGDIGRDISILIGSKLADLLGLSVGDLLYVSSLGRESTYILRISGIYSTGSLKDYEVVMDIDLARKIVGMPDDYISYIAYDGPQLDYKLERVYRVRVSIPSIFSGKIAFYNVLGELVKEVDLIDGLVDVELPYGFYTVYLIKDGLKVKVSEIFVDSVMDVIPEFSGISEFVIITREPRGVSMFNSSGVLTPDRVLDDRVIYRLSPGIYNVSINGETYSVVVMGDSILDLGDEGIGRKYSLSIEVYDESGSPINKYYVTFKSMDGRILRSGFSISYKSSFTLEEGVYEIVISNGFIFSSKIVSLDRDLNISFRLPLLGRKVAERFLESGYGVKAVSGVDALNLAIESYVGITITFYLILPVVLLVLTLTSLYYISRFFYTSHEHLIDSLKYFNYTSLEASTFILKISLPLVFIASLVSFPIYLYINNFLKALLPIFSYRVYGFELLSYLLIVILNAFLWIGSGLLTVKRFFEI